MTALRLTNFGGIIPKLSKRALPDGSARTAANCAIVSGELVPMRKPAFAYAPALATSVKSFFRVDEATWFCWPTSFVKMARIQLDSEGRFCFTGDGVPKITSKTIGTPVAADGEPAQSRTLGIPVPIAGLTAVPTGGVGANVSRFYVYTFYSDWNEESSPSPATSLVTGKVDASWALSGMDDLPPNSGTVTAATYAAGVVTLTLDAGNHYLRALDKITIGSVVGMTDLNGIWPVLGVPANNKITISLTTGQTYTSGGAWSRANPWGACKKRIYRTSSGSKADFQLVALDITGTTYTDTLTDLLIPGDSLITDGWVPPPNNLTGLVALSNGVLAGYFDNTVCLSEPYQPHAWPTAYRKKMSSNIVGIGAFDTNIGVATEGNPVVLTGSDPAQMFPQKHIKPMPGRSRESVVGVGDGVVFATKSGLAKMTIGDVNLITTEIFGPEEWNALDIPNVRCIYDGVKIYIITSTNVVYIINTTEGGAMVTTRQVIEGTHVDELTGGVYFSYAKLINQLDPYSTAPQMMEWWSKEYVLPSPINFGVILVETDADYSADAVIAIAADQAAVIAANVVKIATIGGRGSLNATAINKRVINGSSIEQPQSASVSVAISFYAKEKLVFSATIPSGVIAALPSGYKSDTFSVRIQSNTRVKSVIIADTPGNLKNA